MMKSCVIETMSVDVTLCDMTREPRNSLISSVGLNFINGTEFTFVASDKHLRKIITEMDKYLKSKGC